MKVYIVLLQGNYDDDFVSGIKGVFKTKNKAIKMFKKISKEIKKDYTSAFDIEELLEDENNFYIQNYEGCWDKLTIEESELN